MTTKKKLRPLYFSLGFLAAGSSIGSEAGRFVGGAGGAGDANLGERRGWEGAGERERERLLVGIGAGASEVGVESGTLRSVVGA